MPGKLIFVSGISGAGKTTLIGAALRQLPQLHYLQTVTTRPPRVGETDSFEYKFVDETTYETLKKSSDNWDHTDYQGHKYGADIAAVKAWLHNDQPVICAVAPDLIIINEMEERYGTKPVKIWIDTPASVAKQRIQNDLDRLQRRETERVKSAFDFVFQPSGKIDKDDKDFSNILKHVITRK